MLCVRILMALISPFTVTSHLLFSRIALLLFPCHLNLVYVYAAAENYNVTDPISVLPQSSCTNTTGGSTTGSQKPRVTYQYEIPSTHHILLHDTSKARSINARMSNLHLTEDYEAIFPDSVPFKLTQTFTIPIGLGTPKRNYTVMIDTGSSITWIQCKPCSKSCYPQSEPLFDPSSSTSYSSGSCNPYNHENNYHINYGDGSYSKGSYGCDTLTFDSDVFTNFQFGCSNDSNGDYGSAAGMLGLGQGVLSFGSQTFPKFGKTFMYCFTNSPKPGGYILFGDEAKAAASSSSLKFTPLIRKRNSPFYFLELVGITVAGKRLDISPSVFASPAGTIIDSGTLITSLPLSAYSALRSAFRQLMSRYPSAPPLPQMDTCYDFNGYKKVTVPKIVLNFERGADLNIHSSGILFWESITQVCLAFSVKNRDEDVTIIGITQQLGRDVFYDVYRERIGFGATDCQVKSQT